MKKNAKKEVREILQKALIVILGNLLYAFGVVFFILPSGLITGGSTGIALALHHAAGLPVSLVIGVLNTVMFILGFLVLGKAFALTTLVSTFSYPFLLALLQNAAGNFCLTRDLFLCALFGGLCIGVSLAMILRLGASTGGMDIPPLILNKLFRIPVGGSLYVFDFLILIGQMFFSDRLRVLYGIVLVLIYTFALDRLLAYGASRVELEIISENYKEIREGILRDIDRGLTMVHAKTGFLEKETEMIKCAIAPRELHKIESLIHDIDPDAFVILSRISEVSGRGFSRQKKYIVRPEQSDWNSDAENPEENEENNETESRRGDVSS